MRDEGVDDLVGGAELGDRGVGGAGRRQPGGEVVVPGFVVTTDAYAAVLEWTGLASRIGGQLRDRARDADAAVWAAIREDIAAVTVPDPVAPAIVEACVALGGGPVAVRSSATAEDLPGAAFAGQHDTFLNVIGVDEVLDAARSGC